jgi:3-hexulose-6-phosphate synthase
MSAKLQMVLDHGKYDEVLRIADVLYGHIDILEIGYPQMVTYGLEIVSDIHKAHPDLPLCVDVKVYHGGTGITRRCFEAGASIVTVLASAPDPVIKKMVEHAHEYGGSIMCSIDNPKRLNKRTQEIDSFGVDYVCVSSGFMMEHLYELNKKKRPSIFQAKPLEFAATVKKNLHHAGLAIGTGINTSNIHEVMALDPAVVLVGRGIYESAVDKNGLRPASDAVKRERADTLRREMR